MYDFQFSDSAFATHTLLRQAWIAVNKAMEYRLAKVGLTPEKLAVLWACRDYPGTLIPAEIARLLFREEQTVTGLLNRMEREGLVKRIPKRKGKPFTEIEITRKGEEAISQALPLHKELIVELSSDLSAGQQKNLQESLRALRDKSLETLRVEPRLARGKPITLKW